MTAVVSFLVMPAFALCLVGGILTVLSLLGGWGTLAKVHRASVAPRGHAVRGVHGHVGATRYKGLTLIVDDVGVHLRFVLPWLYPPLCIPWSAIGEVETRTGLLRSRRARVMLRDASLPSIIIEGRPGESIVNGFAAWRSTTRPTA